MRAQLRTARIPRLDGIRALAVMAVLIGHLGRVPWIARVGVTVFFVLSGYLITGLLLAEHQTARDINIRRFYLRRACRIFPAYYLFLLVSWLLLTQTTTPMSAAGGLATATYTANYYSMSHPQELAGLIHTWSLSVEEQFYLIWPAALLLLLRGGLRWVRGALVLAIFIGWGAPGAWTGGFGFGSNAPWLAIGCLLATLPPGFLASWIWAPQWLGFPPLAWVGTISYPMYLWHMWGGALGVQLASGEVERFLLGVIVCVLLASISYYFVERPVLRWRDRRFPTSPPVVRAVPAKGVVDALAGSRQQSD